MSQKKISAAGTGSRKAQWKRQQGDETGRPDTVATTTQLLRSSARVQDDVTAPSSTTQSENVSAAGDQKKQVDRKQRHQPCATSSSSSRRVQDEISVHKERLTPASTVTAHSVRINRRCHAETDIAVTASSPASAVSPSDHATPSRKSKKHKGNTR